MQKPHEIECLSREIDEKWKIEEEFWGQCARLNWVKYEDKNSKFFHIVTMQRRQRKRITKTKDNDGVWIDDEMLIGECFISFFL